jgi:hypothetical protein
MPLDISAKVQQWASQAQPGDIDFNDIHAAIEDLIRKRFHQYGPTSSGPYPDFRERLARWLEQVDEGDQKLLFRLVPHIFFVGREEFASLYRTAYRKSITKWFIDLLNIDFTTRNIEMHIRRAEAETWFCSITDWDLGGFYRTNRIVSASGIRPDFTTLTTLASQAQIAGFMTTNGLRRIVLLEDFIGSGSQMEGIEPLLSSLPDSIPILIVPLIACPGGVEEGIRLQAAYPRNVTFSPVLTLPDNCFVTERPSKDEPAFFEQIRKLVQRLYDVVSGGQVVDDSTSPYGPFGFARIGGLVVLHSNCPDNTLPIIHHESSISDWHALFPRASRLDV